jgi:MoxR-like ATPase
LLKGPTGSGKSTTIKVIAQELGLNLKEWITPADINYYEEDEDGKNCLN